MEPKRPTLGENFERVAPALTVVMLLIGLVAVVYLETNRPVAPTGNLRYFSSETEMARYLNSADGGDSNNLFGAQAGGGPEVAGGDRLVTMGDTTPPPSTAPGEGFSGTNVQVAGVDEADIVKTDGDYLYVVSGGDVVLVKARPAADAAVVSRIEMDTWTAELYVLGDRLVVISHGYPWYVMGGGFARGGPDVGMIMPEFYTYKTVVRVYDVADRAAPTMIQNLSLDGWYSGSRLVDGYAYVLVTEYLWMYSDDVILPAIAENGVNETLRPQDIGYFNDGTYENTLLTVVALNVPNPDQWTHDSYLVGGLGTLYVSATHIYVSSAIWWRSDAPPETAIYRIAIDAGAITFAGSGRVPGYVPNQFSLDERGGYLRVATTTWNWNDGGSASGVYVLDATLAVVGKLEGIAPGESLFATRFLGDRAYLVTFRQIDPFFVIDVSDPANPRELGSLHIPGVSTYLHPYDDDHIIGLGTAPCDGSDQGWPQCVKLSLFDVTDVAHPQETARYIVNASGGSYSEAQYDHKAFLFSREKNLLVIPVQTWSWTPVPPPPDVNESWGNDSWRDATWVDSYYSGWSGAYVFGVTLDGFTLRGNITHADENGSRPDDYWYYGPAVRRSLYIENDLYTVSDTLVKINDLATLDELKAVSLNS